MERFLIPFLALALCPSAQAFWGQRTEATSWPPKSLNDDPDVQVPFFTSIAESCAHFHAMDNAEDAVDARTKPIIDKALDDIRAGLLDPEEGWYERTGFAQRQQKDASQRQTAAAVGVLRTLKYPDWQKYSRYDIDGAGDLWTSQIIDGNEVSKDDSHPDYKFTYMGQWISDVYAACEPYERD